MDRISERGHEMSKYILMHKDNPVAALEIDEASGVISAIGEVYAEEHIPLGITVKWQSDSGKPFGDKHRIRRRADCKDTETPGEMSGT